MSFDVAGIVGAVTRKVIGLEHNGRPAHAVLASRSYDTTVEDVWDALTNAERIPRWFLPITGELRLGGRYQLQGNAGGEITRCEPPRHLALTWEYGGGTSWVTVRLAEQAGGTWLELEHIVPVDGHWEQVGAGAVGVGWDMAQMGLGRYLAGAAAVDAKEAMAWLGSANGKAFVHASSDDWCRAAIASGADEAVAKASAQRTLAAYTSAPAPTKDG
jgi:uncharacterized protein YndB with AHSA1/START domain